MKRASIRVQEPTPELIEKIRRARVAISQQKPRYLKCPYCQHNAMRCRRAYRTIFLRRRYRKHGKKKSISWAGCRRTLPRMCPAMCRNTLTKSVLNLSFLVTKAISKYSSTISRMAAFTTMLSGRTKQNEKARHFYE